MKSHYSQHAASVQEVKTRRTYCHLRVSTAAQHGAAGHPEVREVASRPPRFSRPPGGSKSRGCTETTNTFAVTRILAEGDGRDELGPDGRNALGASLQPVEPLQWRFQTQMCPSSSPRPRDPRSGCQGLQRHLRPLTCPINPSKNGSAYFCGLGFGCARPPTHLCSVPPAWAHVTSSTSRRRSGRPLPVLPQRPGQTSAAACQLLAACPSPV